MVRLAAELAWERFTHRSSDEWKKRFEENPEEDPWQDVRNL